MTSQHTTSQDMPGCTDIEFDPAYEAAAHWVVRLRSTDLSVEDTLQWQAWVNENPANALAFARIEEISQWARALPALAPTPMPGRDRPDGTLPPNDRNRSRLGYRYRAGALLAASFAIVVLTAVLWGASTAPQTLTTTIGENRSVTLNDGSIVTMGGDTRIDVTLSKRARTIGLVRGEAQFKVAKDTNRPFRVQVGDATVVAVGTEFDVQRNSDRSIVSVSEGRVLVEPAAHFLPVAVLKEFRPKLRPVHVDAGQQTITGSAGIEDPVTLDDPAAATAWSTGHLEFRLQPLRYVLEYVNRYARKPIVLEGKNVGELLVTGSVQQDNIGGWIGSLERAFGLKAAERADRIVIRAPE